MEMLQAAAELPPSAWVVIAGAFPSLLALILLFAAEESRLPFTAGGIMGLVALAAGWAGYLMRTNPWALSPDFIFLLVVVVIFSLATFFHLDSRELGGFVSKRLIQWPRRQWQDPLWRYLVFILAAFGMGVILGLLVGVATPWSPWVWVTWTAVLAAALVAFDRSIGGQGLREIIVIYGPGALLAYWIGTWIHGLAILVGLIAIVFTLFMMVGMVVAVAAQAEEEFLVGY